MVDFGVEKGLFLGVLGIGVWGFYKYFDVGMFWTM